MPNYVYKDDREIEVILLARPKMAQLVKIPLILLRLARLIFIGQTSHLDTVYP